MAGPVRLWLQYVNDQMSPEGVEYLKLALYPFLVSSYGHTESLRIPSKVYDFLLENHFQQDTDRTLQWFVRALSLLGGDLRGHRLVDQLQQYDISRPNDPTNIPSDQLFFECLTKIGRKARGLKLEEKLIHAFSRSAFLAINPRNINSLPELFIRLMQREIISSSNTDHLVTILRKNRAKQCLYYLNEYHKSVGKKEIKDMAGSSRSDFAPTSVYESTESSDVCFQTKSQHKYKRKLNDQSLTLLGDNQSDDDSSDSESGSVGSTNIRKPHGYSCKSMIRSRRAMHVFICMTITVAMCLSVGFLFDKLWINIIRIPNLEDVNVYENATVIIGEVDRLYHHQIMVTSVHVPLGQRKVDVYSHDSKCRELPHKRSNLNFTHRSNLTINYTHLYLFSESLIQYKIVPVSSSETVNEDMKGHIYITKGSEIELFSPLTCQIPSPDCAVVDKKSFNGTALFHSIKIKSDETGYYNVHVLINSDYIFEVNISTSAINSNDTEHKCSINQDNSSCNIELPFGTRSRKICLVAYTGHSNSTDFPLYATLESNVSRLWTKWVLLITLLPLTVFWIVVCIIYFFYCSVCKIKH